MREGLENTCRFCQKPVIIVTPSQYTFKDPDNPLKAQSTFWGNRQQWIHKDTEASPCEDGKKHAMPRTICWSELSSDFYKRCETKIAAENVVAKRFACGKHMKNFMAVEQAARRDAEYALQRQEREALDEWRKVEYQKANEILRTEFGAGDLLGDWSPVRFGSRLTPSAAIDVLELLAWATMLRAGEVIDGDLPEEAEAEAADNGKVPWE